MGKNFLNDRQKKILYKNMGILVAMTVVCAVMVRSGILTGGETLEDLAAKQEQTADAAENASPGEIPPDQADSLPQDTPNSSSFRENGSELPDVEMSSSARPGDKNAEASAALPNDGISESATPQPGDKASGSTALQTENETGQSEKNDVTAQEDAAMEDRVTYREGFYYESLSDSVKARITGISYPSDDSDAAISYDMLRYVNVLYCDFNGETKTGELICHKAIAQDLTEIFCELYEAQYPVEKICLVDEYQGNDDLSMEDNNTSCFNYRALPSGRLSNHAYGLAIDLNPFYNPYVTTREDGTVNIAPAGSETYADRDQEFAHKIDREDLACRLFIEHGFTWGGSWRSSKDYQHFEKEI